MFGSCMVLDSRALLLFLCPANRSGRLLAFLLWWMLFLNEIGVTALLKKIHKSHTSWPRRRLLIKILHILNDFLLIIQTNQLHYSCAVLRSSCASFTREARDLAGLITSRSFPAKSMQSSISDMVSNASVSVPLKSCPLKCAMQPGST